MRLLLLILLAFQLGATDATSLDSFGIPDWILPGILAVESRSSYKADGSIFYNNRAVGADGELGCCQVTRDAFDTVYKGSRPFTDLATDTSFCEQVAADYLKWIYNNKKWGNKDWKRTVGMYNAGPAKPRKAARYLRSIIKLGGVP